MKSRFTQIEKFDDRTLKSTVRQDILHPLIDQHNDMAATVRDHENRLTAVEAGGGGSGDGSVDLSGVINRISELEDDINDGSRLVHHSGHGGGTSVASKNITNTWTSLSPFQFNTVESGNTNTIALPTIVSKNSETLSTNEVREGRVLHITNKGAGTLTLSIPDGHRIFTGSSSATTLSIPSQSGVELHPSIYGNGAKEFTVVSTYLANHVPAKKIEMEAVDTRVDTLSTRVTNLENSDGGGSGSGSSEPTKFFVLPIGGQSNCVGYGESDYDIKGFDAPNPRIKQLGRFVLPASETGYGDLHSKLRPFADCNLKIIPATPALDHVEKLFNDSNKVGGTVGFGMYVARLLLPYIPVDYGILIVPCAHGSSAFSTGDLGTWNPSRLSASHGSTRQGFTHNGGSELSPLGKDLYYRTEHALKMNPENKLLPIVWAQGETDMGNNQVHFSEFGRYVEKFKELLLFANLDDRLPPSYKRGDKRINNLQWFCLGPTKMYFVGLREATGGRDTYYPSARMAINNNDNGGEWSRKSIYNNYCYFHNKYKGSDGLSQVYFIRGDVDKTGHFVDTNLESGNGSTGWEGSNDNWWAIHFSSQGYSRTLAPLIASVVLSYGKGVTGPDLPFYPRKIWGGAATILTDNTRTLGTNDIDTTKIKDGLVLWQDFQSGSLGGSLSGSPIISVNGASLVNDSGFGKVVKLNGGNSISYTLSKGETSYTKCVTFKPDDVMMNSGYYNLLSGPTTNGSLFINTGGFYYTPSVSDSVEILPILPWLENCWNGVFNDWQQISVTYDKESNMVICYLNGVPVSSKRVSGSFTLNDFQLGALTGDNKFLGHVASVRVYDRALSSDEVRGLYFTDFESKVGVR